MRPHFPVNDLSSKTHIYNLKSYKGMKLTQSLVSSIHRKRYRKIVNVMRLTIVFCLLSLFCVHAESTYSQATSITLNLKNVKLAEALEEVKMQSDFSFWYRNDEVNTEKRVSISVNKRNISDVLNALLAGEGLSYNIEGNYITIFKPEAKAGNPAVKQSTTVRGRILDETGVPIPGVNVVVKDQNRGVVTDINGYYIIEAGANDVLQFSFIGYHTQEIAVRKKQTIDVVLQEAVTMLDEAVVVGMGTQRKASVVGSIAAAPVSSLRIPQRSLTSALSGKIAGATVVQRSGEPGQDEANFWIRGIATFGNNKTPLILVDGVERSMSDISIEEIENISVLKDASATAVYGVRAANGVVLVNTRKGVAQKPVIEVKLERGIADLPGLPKYLDGPDYAMLYNEAFGAENYSPEYIENLRNHTNPYLYPNVNWFDEVFKKYSNNTSASMTIRGGGDVARYFISASYLEDNGNFKSSNINDYSSNIELTRYNFRSNVDMTLSKTTVLNLEIGANLVDTHTPGTGSTIYGTTYTPAQEIFYHANRATPISNPVRVPYGKDKDGNILYGWGAPAQVGESNPAERLFGSGYGTEYRTQIMSQLVLNQELSMLLKGLKFVGSFSFDSNNGTDISRFKNSSTWAVTGVNEETGELEVTEIDKGREYLGYAKTMTSNRAKELKGQLLYDNLFDEKHRVGGMVMYYQRDYINGAAGSSILALPYRKQGLAARATYSFADRYFGEFNLGYNGSENFPKGKRFGLFPAGAVGYLISNEPFWHVPFINVLKFRGSIGLVGAEALPNGERYGYLSTYGGGLGGYNWGLTETITPGVGEDNIGVTNLTWEKGLKKNIGFELKMFNNAISLDVDYFHERRTDILVQRKSLPAITGTNSQPFANMGEMTNQGVETTAEFNSKIGPVGYRIYGNWSFTRNKIIEQDEAKKKEAYRMRTGHRYGQQFGLIALGLFADQQDIDTSPVQKFGTVRPGDVKYQDLNGDGEITIEDETAIGYSNIPEIIYGFGAQFDYKGFDVGIFFRGQAHVSYGLGGSTFIPFIEGVGKHNLYEKALDRWTVDNPNPNAFYPRISNGRSTNNWQASSRNIYDGSLLRLADIEVGYTFSKKLLAPMGIKSLRIYLLGNNVALFSKWDMWDPETGTQNGSNYPLSRKFNIGLRTSF